MQEIEIKLKSGPVTLRKPNAGIRNKAMLKADTKDGIKYTLMFIELLPMCVKTHPWGVVPIRESLNKLDCDEYDKLIDGLKSLMDPPKDIEKNLESESDQ